MTGKRLRTGRRLVKSLFCRVHPLEVTAQLWNTCDSRCVYCRCPDVQTRIMSTEEWLEIIRELGRLGTIRIKFQGGEPTLRPDFAELSREARRAGMITAVISNGLRFAANPGLLDGLDEAVISLDSLRPEVNDELRGEGAYQGAMSAIDLSLRRGLKTYVNMALSRRNVEDLEPMLAHCERHGIRMNAQPVKFGVRYYDDRARGIALAPDEIRRVYRRMAGWKREGRGLMFSPASYLKAVEWPDLTRNSVKSPGKSKCVAGKYYFHIDPDGDVIPCIPNGADFVPKNILKDGLAGALKHTASHNCGDCWSPYLNERNLLYHFDPAAIRGYLKRG